MNEIKLNDVVNMNVDSFVEKLGGAYSAIINKGLSVKSFPSVMLWGAPGIGKSQGVRQIANKIRVETGKRVEITDVRLLLFNPIHELSSNTVLNLTTEFFFRINGAFTEYLIE